VEPRRFSHLPTNKDRRFRVNDVLLLAEERDRRQGGRKRAPFAAQGESPPIGREYRSVGTLGLRSGVTLRDLIEREGEGS